METWRWCIQTVHWGKNVVNFFLTISIHEQKDKKIERHKDKKTKPKRDDSVSEGI